MKDKKINIQIPILSIVGVVMMFFTSCNQDWPNLLDTNYSEQGTVSGKNNKILIIAVDGISGTAISTIDAANVPTITQMKKKALFSLRSLADFKNNDLSYPTAYANLFTGVTSTKHNYFGDASQSNLEGYSSFIKKLKTNDSSKKIAVFGNESQPLDDFIEDADIKTISSNDQEVTSKAANFIKTENADVVTVFLTEPELVGNASAYSLNNVDYTNAIKKFDENVNLIKSNLEQRSTYKDENWLIIITSTKGGDVTSSGAINAYGDINKDIFAFYYNKNFNSIPVATPNTSRPPFSGASPVFNGSEADNNTAIVANDGGLYNFGTNDFTIRFTMKGSGVDRTWPVFLSKGGRIDDNNPGWRLYISRKLLSMQVGGNGGWSNWGTDLIVNDGNWHNVVVVFFKDNGVRKVKAFVDGVKSARVEDINGRPGITTAEPLRMGRNRADANLPDVRMSHLQLYNVAWTDAEVQSNSCKVEVDNSSLHYNKLVGYWPSDEGAGNTLYNKATAGAGKDFTLRGKYSWASFNDVSELLCPNIKDSFYQIVPNSVDIPYTVYSWLGVPIQSTWGLEGKVWPFTYSNLKP